MRPSVFQEIRYWQGYETTSGKSRHGWFCLVDPQTFVGGPTGKGWGCCKAIAYRRAVKNYRQRASV
jgi:hypothetical protein